MGEQLLPSFLSVYRTPQVMARARVFSGEEFSAATKLDMKERYMLKGSDANMDIPKQSTLPEPDLYADLEDAEKDFSTRASQEPTNNECRRQRNSERYQGKLAASFIL